MFHSSTSNMLPVFLQFDRPRARRSQSLSLALTPEGVLTIVDPSQRSKIQLPTLKNESSVRNEGNFQVSLDVRHFAPEEISVKACDDFLIVEASHEEKRDEEGWVKRFFSRRYCLPDGCNVDAIESRLSSDGVLTVTAPSMAPRIERIVPIVQTGPVRGQDSKVEMGDGEAPERRL